MKNFAFAFILSGICIPILAGCGGSGPTNMVESADKSEIEKYEEMVAADAAAMDTAMSDSGDATAAPAEAPKTE